MDDVSPEIEMTKLRDVLNVDFFFQSWTVCNKQTTILIKRFPLINYTRLG